MVQVTPYHHNETDMKKLADRYFTSIMQLYCSATQKHAFAIHTIALLALFNPILAQSEDVTFTGFMSIVGGKVLNGSRTTPFLGVDCPCFISNWNTLSTYNKNFNLLHESRVGVRMNANITKSLTGVVQVDAKGTEGSSGASMEWAYLSYTPADDWAVQLGRKRLPIYYYSDFMDVGFAYPWVRPPQDLYGWEINNFNGATLVHNGHFADWNSRASVFYGREDSSSNVLAGYFYPGMNVDLAWRDILGADLELSRDWFNVRMVYIQSKVDLSSEGVTLINKGTQRIYGISANVDYNNWLIRSEFSYFDRWQDMGYQSKAGMVSVGYHIGNYTPLVTYSRYRDANSYGGPNWESDTLALTLRYDLNPTSSIKVQYDKFRELSLPDSTTGNARLLSVSFDKIF